MGQNLKAIVQHWIFQQDYMRIFMSFPLILVWNALHIQSNLVWTLFAASDFPSQKSPIIQVSHTASERSGKMEL